MQLLHSRTAAECVRCCGLGGHGGISHVRCRFVGLRGDAFQCAGSASIGQAIQMFEETVHPPFNGSSLTHTRQGAEFLLVCDSLDRNGQAGGSQVSSRVLGCLSVSDVLKPLADAQCPDGSQLHSLMQQPVTTVSGWRCHQCITRGCLAGDD